jgi:hypothetical protein
VTDVLHSDCVCCNAEASDNTPVETVLTLLCMCVHDRVALNQVVADLCFVHRRWLQKAGQAKERG